MLASKNSLLIAICATMMAALIFTTQSPAATYTFTFATHATPDSFRGKAESLFLEEVERITNGEVKFNVYWGESLMAGNEILKGVDDGVVDIGIVNINFFPKQLLFSNALNTIQESAGNYKSLITFFNKVIKDVPEIVNEFSSFNNEVLYVYGVMHYAYASTKPIDKLEDLKGLKARSASRWQLNLLKELGAQPVSVPWSDCTMALQTNVIDAVYANIDAINMVKMEDSAPNVFIFEEFFPTSPFIITMNSKKFKSLPADLQTKLKEAGNLAQGKLIAEFDKWNNSIRENQKNGNYKIKSASPSDYAKWLSLPAIEGNKKQWVKEATDSGAASAQVTLDAIYKIFNEAKTQQ